MTANVQQMLGKPIQRIGRKRVSVAANQLVTAEPFGPGETLPLVMRPTMEMDAIEWAKSNRAFVDSKLLEYGAILFRDFGISEASEFESFIDATSGRLLEYSERSSPRSKVSGNIYTSTDYPQQESIFLHNENSYQKSWPLRIYFFCVTPADTGGETPIADCRNIFQLIPPEIRDRFLNRKWMYVRNFSEGLGLPWQTVFQTSDRSLVEEHCRTNGIHTEWLSGNRLRTYAVREAARRHPETGEWTWFNHATFFHVSTLSPSVRESLLAELGEEKLPANTYYGDGSAIEGQVLDELRRIYRSQTVTFPWKQGDILMLDNMYVAHGRNPFTGPRKILVGMSRLFAPCDDY